MVFAGAFDRRAAERLLWRAGFGPRPGDVDRLVGLGLTAAVRSLTRPAGDAVLTGPEPHDENGPLDPVNAWGHDHLWWLDRMVRSDQPLVERMTLIWHDWWATSNLSIFQANLMLDQNATLRRHALGAFDDLALDVTRDPAMLVFLSGRDNRTGAPNENYARELMELFTLGADRGAYTEGDVRELARSLTGWRSDWSNEEGQHNFRFDPARFDAGPKTVFGQAGAFGTEDAVRLCVTHPLHASFFVAKLWSYFVPVAPDDATRAALESLYVSSGRQIRPVVEAILSHPALYTGPALVKPPVVLNAGLLRSQQMGVVDDSWAWLCDLNGQHLFQPPDVSGWNDARWLDTSTTRGRWMTVTWVQRDRALPTNDTYDATEDPGTALARALAYWGDPPLTAATRDALLAFAADALATSPSWAQRNDRALRQNALRQLVAVSPDYQVC